MNSPNKKIQTRCREDKCDNHALFMADFCWDHLPDKEGYSARLLESIKSGVSIAGANLSKIDLRNADLSRQDLSHSNLTRADLSNSLLFDSNLKGAELLGADLRGSDLTSADLQEADLTKACLHSARLWHTNLEGAYLLEADLSKGDFWNAKLFNAKLWRTNLDGALSIDKLSFSKERLFYSIHMADETGAQSAKDAYRVLKSYFLQNGKYEDASWASYREKTMERLLLKKRRDITYISSLFMDILCGYGERAHRIILSSLFVIAAYAIIYLGLNAVYTPNSPGYAMKLTDYFYYSVITFTTAGYGDFVPKAATLFKAVAASEAFLGVFMMGLFVYTLARKYSARG